MVIGNPVGMNKSCYRTTWHCETDKTDVLKTSKHMNKICFQNNFNDTTAGITDLSE